MIDKRASRLINVVSSAVAFVLLAALVWLLSSANDPLALTCASVNADPGGAGMEAANAVYSGLSTEAQTHTTPATTHLYLVMRCREQPDATLAQIRDRLEHNLNAAATPQ